MTLYLKYLDMWLCVRACMKSFYTDTDIETDIDIYLY